MEMKEDPLERLDRLEKEKKSGSNSAYIVIGAFVDTALRAAQQNGAAVLVLRMLKPIDDVIVQQLSEYEHITFIEDGCYSGVAAEGDDLKLHAHGGCLVVAGLAEELHQAAAEFLYGAAAHAA